jgi:hypothetical protein
MRKITARRTSPDLTLVHTENELAVGADMDNKVFQNFRSLDHFPEMQNDTVPLGRTR